MRDEEYKNKQESMFCFCFFCFSGTHIFLSSIMRSAGQVLRLEILTLEREKLPTALITLWEHRSLIMFTAL